MKKITLLIALILLVNISGLSGFAASSAQNVLGKIENSLYGFQYTGESDSARLDRIEKSVYGTPFSSKSSAQRIEKLRKDLSAELIGQEITPVEDTFAEPDDVVAYEPPQKEASNITYPAVDELEKEVFKKTFGSQDITVRLSNLEKKTFNKTYSDDLNSRVERLKAQIAPASLMENRIADASDAFYDDDYVVPKGGTFHMNRYESPDRFDYDAFNARSNSMFEDYDYSSRPAKKASLSTVEKKLMKQNYSNDTMENRLARVESYMFGTVFSSDDTQTRIDRISSAYNAQKSSGKYDSNKFAQNMTTGVQIGMLILMVLACIL